MTKNDDVQLTQSLINKDFAFDEELPESASTLEELKKQLIPLINQLLDRDMGRLMNALYRIDVNESKVKQVLVSEQPGEIAPKLADLIIDRQLQKVITRKKYRS